MHPNDHNHHVDHHNIDYSQRQQRQPQPPTTVAEASSGTLDGSGAAVVVSTSRKESSVGLDLRLRNRQFRHPIQQPAQTQPQQIQLQLQPPQRSASYQSYSSSGPGGGSYFSGGTSSLHLQQVGSVGTASRQSSSTPTSPVQPALFGVGSEHWRPLGPVGQDRLHQARRASTTSSSGDGDDIEPSSDLGSIFRPRLDDIAPATSTASTSAIGSSEGQTFQAAATFIKTKTTIPNSSTVKTMAPTVTSTVVAPESPREQQKVAPPTAGGAPTSSASSPGGTKGAGRSPIPSNLAKNGNRRDLSPHRGVESPSPPASSESSKVDESDEFGTASIVHPELMLPEYSDAAPPSEMGAIDQSGIDMDMSAILPPPHHPPVSRNLTDAFESLAVGGAAAVADDGQGSSNARTQGRTAGGHQDGDGPPSGREDIEEGREDVEEEGRSLGGSTTSGGASGGGAASVPVSVPTVTPGTSRPGGSLAPSAAQDIQKQDGTDVISPAGVEMLDVEGQLQQQGAQGRAQLQQQDEKSASRGQEQLARQPSGEEPKPKKLACNSSMKSASAALAAIPSGEGTRDPMQAQPLQQLQQQGQHPAPPQDAPRRSNPGGDVDADPNSSGQAPATEAASELDVPLDGKAVIPFRLHPDLQLDLPSPVVERVSFYGVMHDINATAGGMAEHDDRNKTGVSAGSSSSGEAPIGDEAAGGRGEAPKNEEYSPLVVAVNGPPPEEFPRLGGDEAVSLGTVTKPAIVGTGTGLSKPSRAETALIDEERWLLLVISTRSPEEIAERGLHGCPATFAEAIGERDPAPHTHTPPTHQDTQETGEDTLSSSAAQGQAQSVPGTNGQQQAQTANPLSSLAALSGSRTQLWKPSRSWWEAKSGKNPWIEPNSHNKRWRYLWPLIHYHKFLARCIKKLKRNGVDVRSSLSPVSAFLRDEVCAISDHLARCSRFNSEEWMSALVHFTGWTEQNPQAEERLRELVSRQKLRGWGEVEDVDSPLLRDQIDGRFLMAMAGARESMARGGEPQYGGKRGRLNGGALAGGTPAAKQQQQAGRPPMPPSAGSGRQTPRQLSTISNPKGGPPMYPYGEGEGYGQKPGTSHPSPSGAGQPPRSSRKGKQRRGSRGGGNKSAASSSTNSDAVNEKGAGWDAATVSSAASSQSPHPPPPYDPSMMHGMYHPPGLAYGGAHGHGYGINPYYPHPSQLGGHHHNGGVPMPDYYYQQAAAAAAQGYHHDPSAYGMPHSYMDPHWQHGWDDGSYGSLVTDPQLDTSMHSEHSQHGPADHLQQQHFSSENVDSQQMHLQLQQMQQQQLSAMASSPSAPLPVPCTPDQSMDYGYNNHAGAGDTSMPSPAWAHLDQFTTNLIATPHQTPSTKRTARKGRRSGGPAAKTPGPPGSLVFTTTGSNSSVTTGSGANSGRSGSNVPPSPATQFAQSQSPTAYLPRIQGGGGVAGRKQIGGIVKEPQPQMVETTSTTTGSTTTASAAMDSSTSTNPADLSRQLAPPEVRRTTSNSSPPPGDAKSEES